jgi:hypothetical protein
LYRKVRTVPQVLDLPYSVVTVALLVWYQLSSWLAIETLYLKRFKVGSL